MQTLSKSTSTIYFTVLPILATIDPYDVEDWIIREFAHNEPPLPFAENQSDRDRPVWMRPLHWDQMVDKYRKDTAVRQLVLDLFKAEVKDGPQKTLLSNLRTTVCLYVNQARIDLDRCSHGMTIRKVLIHGKNIPRTP